MEVLSTYSDLLLRVITTTSIVIIVAALVGKLGPIVGGIISGLPIGLGPGFWFLLTDRTTGFLSQAATSSLVALTSTQIFLLCYSTTTLSTGPVTALTLSVLTWFGSSITLGGLSLELSSAAVVFLGVTFVTLQFGRKTASGTTKATTKEHNSMLVFRAVCAGVLVGIVTTVSPFLGPHWSGQLLAFPIGFTLIGFTVARRYGPNIAAALLHSTILGTLSLASFCIGMGLGLEYFGKVQSFWIAMMASVSTTIALTLAAQFAANFKRKEPT